VFNLISADTAPGEPVRCSAKLDGVRIQLELDLRDYMSRLWYYFGYRGYEAGTTRLMRRLLAKKRCVFDIGANVGYYTLMAGALLAGRGEVHAFEPAPTTFTRLRTNVRLNGFGHVVLNHAGMLDHNGTGILNVGESADNSSFQPGFARAVARVEVPTIRFDSYCRDAGVRRADLIKIDAEGVELAVLQGMGNLLLDWHPDLILEVLPAQARAIESFIAGTPYRRFLVKDDGLLEVAAITVQDDLSLRDYYLMVDP
jgi:FkbM family methyltransferase